MGNTSGRPHPRQRNKKQVHWRAADRPTKPGKPQLISDADYTPDVITIRWDRPLKDGGSPITGYLVEHRRTGSPHWVRATPLLVPFPELTLSGLEPGWRYQFRVRAENAVGLSDPSEISEPLTVTLQRSAVTSPRFTQELKDATALENDKVEFVTYFLGQPAPKISWFKDGFEIFSSRRIRILTESDRSVLTIHQSQLVDAGEIRCSATNKAGHVTTTATLILEAPPTIRLPRQYEDGLLFEIGEVIRLKISVAGLPVPLIFWSHNGESIQNSERYEIETYDNSTTLRITEARRSDRGEYQVKAINKLGQDQASFLVTVTDKPSSPGKARVVMTLGRSVTLAWDTPEDDGGCKIGNYIIEYYRLGWDVWLKAATSRQLTTVLGDLIEGSQYKFRVKAESPYGISEPSEESDVVFIPDTKRGGIFPAPPRSASQPREMQINVETAPDLPQRKNKPRSQSSSRVEEHRVQFNIPNGVPVRPERGKLKSPQRTPEQSPGVVRRELNAATINKNIFDRSSIARDLSYGTPEFKITKTELGLSSNENKQPAFEKLLDINKPKSTIQTIDNKRPRSPSPIAKTSNAITKQEDSSFIQQILNVARRSKSPTPERSLEALRRSKSPSRQLKPTNVDDRSHSPIPNARLQSTRSPSPSFRRKSKDFTGSSEFMLVLLPNGNKDREASDIDFHFDENQIPPPLSLSAPELGTEPPTIEGLKYSASSTELLHERAMIRFYEAAEAEELQLKKRLEKKDSQERRPSVIPKIQINNQDEEDIALERQASLRRRYSAGITTPQQVLWAQKRHSLRNSEDLDDLVEGRLKRYSLTPDEKREIMLNRTRSESEEKEEEEFEKIRARIGQSSPKMSDRKNVDIADLNKWDNEYEESVSEEESSEEDERIYDQVPDADPSGEEDTTYHPTMRSVTERKVSEPFEILIKPNKLPDPNFVPKPILKRSVGVDLPKPPGLLNTSELRSSSPTAQSSISNRRPSSPLLKMLDRNAESVESKLVNQQKRGSLPWSAPLAFAINENNDDKETESNKKPLPSISTIAGFSSIAAAGIVIPKSLLAKKAAEEEAKVVVDHYADIVRSHSNQKNSVRPIKTSYNYETDIIELNLSPPVTPELPPEPINPRIQNAHPSPLVQEEEIVQISRNETNFSPGHLPSSESKRWLPQNIDDTDSHWNDRNYNGNTRGRTDSSSSSHRSSSPTKFGRMRRGSPTVRNKDVATFRVGREPKPQEEKKVSSRPPSRTRTPSKSPGRRRKASESPRRMVETSTFSTQTEVAKTTFRKSPSPQSAKRAPKMKEIMTQTSACIDNFIVDAGSTSGQMTDDQQLKKYAEKKVRTTVDYVTDLAMFIVACWLYLFSNELLAIPPLLIMVYRQLEAEISKRTPKWLIPKRKKQT